MNLDAILETIPSFAKDLKLNFSGVVRPQTDLNEQHAWGTLVACAIASRNEQLTAAALEEARSISVLKPWKLPRVRQRSWR